MTIQAQVSVYSKVFAPRDYEVLLFSASFGSGLRDSGEVFEGDWFCWFLSLIEFTKIRNALWTRGFCE